MSLPDTGASLLYSPEVFVSVFRSFWFWLIAALMLGVVIWQGAVRGFFSESVFPFENAGQWAKRQFGLRISAAWEAGKRAVDRDSMAHEIERLRIALAEAELTQQENNELRRQLQYVERMKGRVIAAPVLVQGGALGLWAQLKIGRGSVDGIEENAVVVVPEGVVGRVTDVRRHTATVMLISDPASRVACEVVPAPEGVDSLRGVLYGKGGKRGETADLGLLYLADPMRLQFLPRDSVLTSGARVVTSGAGGVFPKGLDVGKIVEDGLSDDRLYREASVYPAVDAMTLSYVYVYLTQGGGDAR